MKSSRKKSSPRRELPVPGTPIHERVRPWLLLVMAALFVARPLLPSEGVAWLGDGQPLVLGWIALAAGYFLWAIAEGRLARPLELADAGVTALVAIAAASAVAGMYLGSPRYSLNMLCEWVALGLGFLLVRQLIFTRGEARALIAVMIALAVVQSGYGLHQVLVDLPAERAAYLKDPDAALLKMGQWLAPGSPERMHFENRLMSVEPLATFALTNSLAGFLVAWLAMMLGIGLNLLAGGGTRWGAARTIGFVACTAVVAYCLVLTKSRSAFVALLVGCVLLPFCISLGREWLTPRRAAAAAIGLAAIVGLAIVTGGLDSGVLTQAKKSLGYRLEYWQSTLTMIGDYPWLGIGPGNFQDYYTQYKLPQASEEIRDPHNFLLEVWSTSGTFAMLVLVATLGLIAYRTIRYRPAAATESAAPSDLVVIPSAATYASMFIIAGAGLGFLLAFIAGPPFGWFLGEGRLIAGPLVGGAVVWILWPWIASGTLPARLPALAALVLLVNLLAAGGILYPGVAGTLWMLLALALNQYEPEIVLGENRHSRATPQQVFNRRAMFAVGLAACCVGAVAVYRNSVLPVLRLRAAMEVVNEARQADPRSASVLPTLLLDAAEADTWSPEPWMALAELELDRLERDPRVATSEVRAEQVAAMMFALRPRASAAHQMAGRWYRHAYERNGLPEAGTSAIEAMRAAVLLYPNSPQLRGEYALFLAEMNEAKQARRQAEAALALDQQTPHADKKLPEAIKRQLQGIVEKPPE